jgi:hypothetical protein
MDPTMLQRAIRCTPQTDRALYDALREWLALLHRQNRAYDVLHGALRRQAETIRRRTRGTLSPDEALMVLMFALWGFRNGSGGGRPVPGALEEFLDTPTDASQRSLLQLIWRHCGANLRQIHRALARDDLNFDEWVDAPVGNRGLSRMGESIDDLLAIRQRLHDSIDELLQDRDLTDRQRKLLFKVFEDPFSPNYELAESLRVSEATLSRELSEIRILATRRKNRKEQV